MPPSSEFAWKLHQLLGHAEANHQTGAISWTQTGDAFAIHNRTLVEQELLPLFFRHGRIRSLQRNLQIYGFRRHHLGVDRGAYFHPCFIKGKAHLCEHIRRTNGQKSGEASSHKRGQQNMNVPPTASSLNLDSLIADTLISSQKHHRNMITPDSTLRGIQDTTSAGGGGDDDLMIRHAETVGWMLSGGCSQNDVEELLRPSPILSLLGKQSSNRVIGGLLEEVQLDWFDDSITTTPASSSLKRTSEMLLNPTNTKNRATLLQSAMKQHWFQMEKDEAPRIVAMMNNKKNGGRCSPSKNRNGKTDSSILLKKHPCKTPVTTSSTKDYPCGEDILKTAAI